MVSMPFPEGLHGWPIEEESSFADISTELRAMDGLPVWASLEQTDDSSVELLQEGEGHPRSATRRW